METRNQNPGSDVGSRPNPAGGAPHNDPDRIRQDMKQAGEAVREQARTAGEQIKSSASDAGRQAKEKAGQVAEQAQRKAAEYAKQAQTQGVQMLDQQKARAAEQVNTLGDAVRRAADKFRETKDDNIAGYIDAAADEVQRVGQYLERRDLSNVWRDAQAFGRRRPEWFLGGMFVAGLALTRFLKASADRQESQQMQGGRWYEPPQQYGGQADIGHRLPDPAHATHRFAGTSGGGGSSGGMSASVSPSSALGTGGMPGTSGTSGIGTSSLGTSGLGIGGTGTSATRGTAGTSAPAGTSGPPSVYGLSAVPTGETPATPASIPTLTIPTSPAPTQPRTQPEVH